MKVLTAFIITAMAAQAAAQAEDDNVYEIVTTAIHTNVAETALPITVLAGEELRNATRATIGETLANLPGINSASFGPAVGQPVIRGQQGRRVLVLNNSISNADVSANSADHANTIEPILADAVEVLRGPSTLLFGSGAMGGVVNVIDRRVPRRIFESPEFNLETRHDTAADESTIVGSLDFSTGNFSWHLDGVRREWNDLDVPSFAIAEGYLEENHEGEHDEDHDEEHAEHEEEMENTFGYVGNTGGESEAFTFGGSFVFDNGFIGLAVNRIDNTYGLPEGAHTHEHEEEHGEEHDEDHDEEHGEEHGEEEKNVFIDMARIRYDLTGEWRNLTPLIEHVDYRLTYTEYEHNELEGIGEIGTTFSNEGWQQRLQMTHTETAGWHGVFGIQTADEEFGAVGEESYIPVVDVSSMGLFLVEDYHMEDLTLEFGARFNKDEYGPTNIPAPGRDFDTFSLSVSALWDISPLASFGANWSRSERAPSVEELYSNFGLADIEGCVIHFATSACEIGNSNFSEEESNNFDLQVNLTLENMTLSIAVFNNDFDNYIAQIATGEEIDEFAVREYRQIDASFSGFEVDATFLLSDNLSLNLFADTVNGRQDGNGDAPRMPPRRIGGRLDYSLGNWSAFLSVLDAARQDSPGDFELETDGYTRWDIGANYQMILNAESEITWYIRGRNLGDEEIRLSTSFLRGFAPEAGRSIEVGARFSF